MYTSFSVLCLNTPPPLSQMPEFPNTSYFQTAFASYFAWFPSNTCSSNLYLLYRCIMRGNIFFYLHENVLDPKFINRYQGTSHQKHQWKEIFEPPKSITFSWPGKCFFFIAEIKETGIHCEISSPIWYIFYLLPDKKSQIKKEPPPYSRIKNIRFT